MVRKKLVTISVNPEAWKAFQALVAQRYGKGKASSHMALLIEAESSRLAGRADVFLNSTILFMREYAAGIKEPEPKKTLDKLVEGIEVWMKQNKDIAYAASNAGVHYADLQKQYESYCEQCEKHTQTLKNHGTCAGLLARAKEFGLDLKNDDVYLANVKQVIAKLRAEASKPDWPFNTTDLQLFIKLCELGRDKRLIYKKMNELQNNLYPQEEQPQEEKAEKKEEDEEKEE